MKFECYNCDGLTDEEDVVMVSKSEQMGNLVPYCRTCWNIIMCKNPNEK